MTLDDETAERLARGVIEALGEDMYDPRLDGGLVRAGYAARDAEVEELRARLARVREWAEVSDRPHIESWDLGYEHATIDVLAILEEGRE